METDYLNKIGVGAGFDTKVIVSALVEAEKASKQSYIDRRTTEVDAKISGMALLKSSMQTLQTAFQKVDDKRDFNFSALSNSAPEKVYANFDSSTSVPGTYKISVSQLAQNDVIQSSNYTSKTADQNSSSAATVTIQVGSGATETVSLGAGSASLDNLVTGINALTADVSARIVETSTGNYRVVVEGPQGSANALTITDSVFGLQNTNVLEVDTYTLGAPVASGGSATFTYGGTAYTQAYDTSAANTIVLLAAKVNAASGITVAAVSGSGVAFTITNDVGSDTQMTKGTISGTTDNSTALSISTADTTAGTAINKIQTAQNSAISINGLSVSSATNQIEAVAPGLTIDLMETTSSAVVLSVGRDSTNTKASIISVVESYNAFETAMKDLTAVTNAAGERGVLNNDSGIRQIRTAMYKLMTNVSSTPGTTITSLADMGITRTKAGVMIIDQVALGSAVTNNYDEITKIFSADTNNQLALGDASRGLAGDIVKQVSDYLATTGVLASRGTTYTAMTATVLKEQTALDLKMDAAEARYTKQFSTMNKIMEEMKSTQEYLKSQLENLPFTSNND